MTLSHAAKELGKWCDATTGIECSSGVSEILTTLPLRLARMKYSIYPPPTNHHSSIRPHHRDVIATPALAHVASAEGICCVEKIAGLNPEAINYDNIPGCTYASPEIGSVGITEKAAKEKGIEYKIGKFPFTASGKAAAAGDKDGFVKLVIDAKTDKVLGVHMIGANVTEMVSGIVVARNLGVKASDLMHSIHPHPTMSEAIMEAAAASHGEVIHI